VDLLGATGYDYGSMMLSDRLLAAFVFARILQSVLELYVVFSMNSQMLEDDLRQATAQIERMASTDALTGVLNRRGLAAFGADALRRSQRRRRPSSVIMLDLDWFKQVNDTLGHVAAMRCSRPGAVVRPLPAGGRRVRPLRRGGIRGGGPVIPARPRRFSWPSASVWPWSPNISRPRAVHE
jgi:predicted signal transduction protein with EAL and GGDEF domain